MNGKHRKPKNLLMKKGHWKEGTYPDFTLKIRKLEKLERNSIFH